MLVGAARARSAGRWRQPGQGSGGWGQPSFCHPWGVGAEAGDGGPGRPQQGCPSLGPWKCNDRPVQSRTPGSSLDGPGLHPQCHPSLVSPRTAVPTHIHLKADALEGHPKALAKLTPQLSLGIAAGMSWRTAGRGRRETRRGRVRRPLQPHPRPLPALSEGWAASSTNKRLASQDPPWGGADMAQATGR